MVSDCISCIQKNRHKNMHHSPTPSSSFFLDTEVVVVLNNEIREEGMVSVCIRCIKKFV